MDKDYFKSIPNARDPIVPKIIPSELAEETEEQQKERQRHEERTRADSLRLLGLNRSYDAFSAAEKEESLVSKGRKKAFENIDTSTNPREPNREKKRGIVTEVIKRKLIEDQVLKIYPLVYLGSGTDVEYPISMGARHIVMVDYIFSDPKAVEEVVTRLKGILAEDLNLDGKTIRLMYDFGQGQEQVEIALDSSYCYSPKEEKRGQGDSFVPPDEIGVLLAYASQGPLGRIKMGEDIIGKVVKGGAIIEEDNVIRIVEEGREEIRLGKEIQQ